MVFEWEWTILNGIQKSLRCAFLDSVMPVISLINDNGVVWIAFAVGFLAFRRHRRGGILLLMGLVLGLLIGNVLLKNVFMRPRPCWLNDTVSLLVANPTDYSFPSGHTLSSAIAATLITLECRKLGWIAIPLAVLIAFSRMYLYVHFPTDVLGAAVLGVAIGLLVWRLLRPVTDRWTLGRGRAV